MSTMLHMHLNDASQLPDIIKQRGAPDHGYDFYRKAWRRNEDLSHKILESNLESEVSPFSNLTPLPRQPELVEVPGTKK